MLKFTCAINTLLAGFLVVPAILSQSGETKSLEQSLAETVRALECLSGLEKTAIAGDPNAIERVKTATESPLSDAQKRDALLVELRNDVGRLQMTYDEIVSRRAPQSASTEFAHPSSISRTNSDELALPSMSITTGLDDDARRMLSNGDARSSPAPRPTKRTMPAEQLEADGFNADPIRQGQACYRAGRHAQCIDVLKPFTSDVHAQYWSARALEKLEHVDEAIEIYRKVATAADAGSLAERARNDLEFLEWKRDFTRKIAAQAATKDTPQAKAAVSTKVPAQSAGTAPTSNREKP